MPHNVYTENLVYLFMTTYATLYSTFDFVCATYKVSVFFLLLTMTAYRHTDDGMEYQRA